MDRERRKKERERDCGYQRVAEIGKFYEKERGRERKNHEHRVRGNLEIEGV